jgi:hypothetical protein
MANLSLTIPQDTLNQLRVDALNSTPKKTVTTLVQEIIIEHYKNLSKENLYPEAAVITQKDWDEIKKFWMSQPIKEPDPLVLKYTPSPLFGDVGLQIPEAGSVKKESDPEIKSAFSIQPGPGVHLRLKSIGVSPQSVINARRAKNVGRDYDKSLEQYFNLL